MLPVDSGCLRSRSNCFEAQLIKLKVNAQLNVDGFRADATPCETTFAAFTPEKRDLCATTTRQQGRGYSALPSFWDVLLSFMLRTIMPWTSCGPALITALLLASALLSSAQATRPLIHPFPLSAVRLYAESHFAKAAELNRQYVMSLDTDSMLYTFRKNAEFDTPGETFAGSWEDPGCEVRGQFMGHYLSATATLLSQTGGRSTIGNVTGCSSAD